MKKVNKKIFRISLISLLVLLVLGSSIFLIYKYRPKADPASTSVANPFNLRANLSVSPGIVAPGGQVQITVKADGLINQVFQDSQKSTSPPAYSISVYFGEGTDPVKKETIDADLASKYEEEGWSFNYQIPTPAVGIYNFSAKIFADGVYLEGSKADSAIQIKNDAGTATACGEGSVGSNCTVSVAVTPNIIEANNTSNNTATFVFSYRDGETGYSTASQVTLILFICGNTIQDPNRCNPQNKYELTTPNDGGELSTTWSSNPGTDGTYDGQHLVFVKAFKTGTDGITNLFAVGYTSLIVNNSQAPDPNAGTTPAGQPTEKLTPGDLTGGSSLLDFVKSGNPFDKTTLIGKITAFAVDTIGILAFLSFLVAGLIYITSGGDPAKAEKAKKTMLYSIIALVVLVLSYAIISYVIETLNKIFGK